MSATKRDRREHRRASALARRNRNLLAMALVILTLVALATFLVLSNPPAESSLASAAQLELGEQVYAQTCAVCHGAQGQGHVLPAAPALDASEHAWHHPDGQIQQLILEGGPNMPALGGQLSDEEVVAVIRYIQTWWTPEQLAAQQELSRQFPLR